jgi:phospholipase A1
MDKDSQRPRQPSNRCANPASRHQVNFGYTQKSRWKLYDASAPFEENNYNPEIYYSYNTRDLFGLGPLDWVTMGFEHESNGEDDDESRSWNRIYGQLRLQWKNVFGNTRKSTRESSEHFKEGWQARLYLKAWTILPAGTDDNANYGNNLGHFKVVGTLHTPDYHYGSGSIDIEGSAGHDFDRGSVLAGLSYRPPIRGGWRFVPHLYGQLFSGYGESLIRSDTKTQAIRIGLRFIR